MGNVKGCVKINAKRLLSVCLIISLVIGTIFVTPKSAEAAENTLLNTYGSYLQRSGTCINLYQLRDAQVLEHVKAHYNSITLENEMKPDAMLGWQASLMTLEEAQSNGYYIPEGYSEDNVPRIKFSSVDEVMKICYENGLGMRAHTLVWHS